MKTKHPTLLWGWILTAFKALSLVRWGKEGAIYMNSLDNMIYISVTWHFKST